jgi:parvulin-like peptidyl-prolyl isomerase
VLSLVLLAACGREEPDRVLVDQIVISFRGAHPRVTADLSREAAERLAHRILDQLRRGESFERLKQEHSTDRSERTGAANGPYDARNLGQPYRQRADGIPVVPRSHMAKSWGDLAFRLEVGEVGMAEYDPEDCPYGWHILKRLK